MVGPAISRKNINPHKGSETHRDLLSPTWWPSCHSPLRPLHCLHPSVYAVWQVYPKPPASGLNTFCQDPPERHGAHPSISFRCLLNVSLLGRASNSHTRNSPVLTPKNPCSSQPNVFFPPRSSPPNHHVFVCG